MKTAIFGLGLIVTLATGTAGVYAVRSCETCGFDTAAQVHWIGDPTPTSTDAGPSPAVTSEIADLRGGAAGVRADFVEARSASVFAGACHVASEAASQGRQALMAWSIREGASTDADLSGVRVVAAVSGDRNLAEGGERTSVVWIDAPDGEAQLRAAKAWLSAEHGAALGEVRRVESHPVQFDRDGDAFAVVVGDVIELRGEAIADGSCCSMQEHRWYEPLGASAGQPVGVPDACSFAGAAGLPSWRYEGANNTFVGEYVGAATSCETTARKSNACEPSPCAQPRSASCDSKSEPERCEPAQACDSIDA